MPSYSYVTRLILLVFTYAGVGGCAEALISPKTIVDRAIEARSTADIADDNRIVVAANALMAELKLISASTEIYEQRLLVTGIIESQNDYDAFKQGIEDISGVKKLYWHVVQMSEAEQQAQGDALLSWADALALDAMIGVRLFEREGVADVNFREGVDSFATVYLLGRARSQSERDIALAATQATKGVKKVVNYVEVRP
jgi:hyperosmotically inducible protein